MKIYIIGYEFGAYDANNRPLDAPQMPSLFNEVIDLPVARPRRSKVFPPKTRFIEVVVTGDCWLDVGMDPEAREEVHPLYTGERRFYGVFPGHCLSVLGVRDVGL